MERYESLGVVGEGSYGVVLKCRHRESGQIVAVKKFLESDEDANVKKIALREVRMLKKVRHENLVNLIEFFRRKRRLYLVFEYVDHTILDELDSADTGLDPAIARSHIFQVIRGVAYCHHNQIIHRDVKPENVLVSRLGVVKLCDFGFARVLEGPNESCTDYVATRWYRAPELLVGDTKYGREVDIWAIGCLLAEILSGDPLFPGESDIDQLFHIIQTLGELTEYHRSLVARNPMLSGLRLPSAASTPLATSFPKWCQRTHLFISECLSLTPSQRPTADGLLKHAYFTHDSFPETFLPELRKKVQQEFHSNPSIVQNQTGRKGSGHNDKKLKNAKHENHDADISKSGTKIMQQHMRHSPSKQSLQTTINPHPATHQEPFSNPPMIPSHLQTYNQLYNQSDIMPFPANNSNKTNNSSGNGNRTQPHHQYHTQASNQSINHPSHLTQSSDHTTRSFVTYTTLPSGQIGNRSKTTSAFPLEEGPISLPFSHIPPLKETSTTNGSTNGLFYSNSNISSIFDASFQNQYSKNSSPRGTLNFQLMSSPTRKLRREEKSGKPNSNFWSTSTNNKNQNLHIKGQSHIQHLIGSSFLANPAGVIASARENISLSLPQSENSPLTVAPLSPYSRHSQFDFSRHPYAISLDRTKESSGRESSRDPLREIRENPKETKWSEMASRDGKESHRKSRKESVNWAKPKLLNDDLSLPNLLAVPRKSSSPKKTIRTDAAEERGWRGDKIKIKKRDFMMPRLEGLERGSASSGDSADTLRPDSNLPYV